jgi:hypothetical protein
MIQEKNIKKSSKKIVKIKFNQVLIDEFNDSKIKNL